MLEFKFHFTKTANLFHFISNLTEWHFSCRKGYNKIWLEKTGPLNDKEKRALRRLAKLLIKYHFSSGQKGPNGPSKFLGIPFTVYTDKEVWKKVEEWVEPDEFLTLKDVFEVFGSRFEKLWAEEEPKLVNWKAALVKELSKKKYDDLEKDLETFFNQKPKFYNIDVHLLINTTGIGGGANIGPGRITLECIAFSVDYLPYVLGTFYHEVTHLTFEHGYYQDLLEQFLKSTREVVSEKYALLGSGCSRWTIINEGVVSSLLPDGYLAPKHLGIDVSRSIEHILGKRFEKLTKDEEDNLSVFQLFTAAKLYPLTKSYIENKKPVDKVYLQAVWEVFEDFSERTNI